MNSINGGNSALVVIDGLQGGNLSSLNPNDIESIEILKDAAATAIYGSRGANGVLLITTKGGKKGKPMIDYSYSYGSQNLRKKIDLMNAYDYALSVNKNASMDNSGGNVPNMIFTDEEIAGFKTNGGTDWQDEAYRAAAIKSHQITMSGGADNVSYLISGGYMDQQGILLNTDYTRYSLRANFNAKVTEHVSFGVNWAGTKENSNVDNYGGTTSTLGWNVAAPGLAIRWAPTVAVYDADGNYIPHPNNYGIATSSPNPVATQLEPLIDNVTVRNNIGANLDFKIIEGLTLKIMGGAVLNSTKNKSYYGAKTRPGKPSNGTVGAAVYGDLFGNFYQNSNILTYDKTLSGKHHLTLTAVAEQQAENYSSLNINASKFTVDQTGADDLGGASQIDSKSTYKETRTLNSYLGRVHYGYAEKYLFTFSYRADGSSVFGANNKWGYFPATSAAWRLSEESFIKDMRIISNLKLRGSWGITGNQGISPYQTMAKMASGANYPYNGGSSTDIGFVIANAANPDLKWESTTQTNIGLDLGMYKGRLTASIDYYVKTTDDLLLNKTVPSYTGFTGVMSNVGSIENKGLEIMVGGDPYVGDFKWNTSFNISFNRSKVLSLGDYDRLSFVTTGGGYGVDGGIMELRTGEPFGQMYGYGTQGVWRSDEAAEAAKYGTLPGTIHYTDVDKDGIIDDNDIMVIGNAQPKFIYGFTNRLSYKDIELTFLIQGSHGNQMFNGMRPRLDSQWEGTSTRLLDAWVANTNENTEEPGYIDGQTWDAHPELVNVYHFGENNENALQRYVEDASYLRFKNITLAYNLPIDLIGKVGFTKLRAYMSLTNYITFTKYSGYDPEVSSYNNNDAEMGIDFNNYPSAKTITFGIDVSF
jgi:TonB-linked SusC/RagA family outer membrane protein